MDGYITIGTKIDTSGVEEGIDKIEDMGDDIQLDLNTNDAEKSTNKIDGILTRIKNKVVGISTGAAKTLLSIGQMVAKIAVIGGIVGSIITLFVLLGKGLVDNLKQSEKFNESIAKIKYLIKSIANAIIQVLSPVINFLAGIINSILNTVVRFLTFIATIIQSIFKVNVLGQKFAKNMDKASGSAQEIKKSLAGFDEMNILNSQNASAGGGVSLPTEEFFELKEASSAILDYLANPVWENFGDAIKEIGVLVSILGLAFAGLPGLLIGVGTILVGIVIDHWTQIKNFLLSGVDWLYNLVNNMPFIFQVTIGQIFTVFADLISGITALFDGLFTGIKYILDGIINIFKGNFKTGIINVLKGIANIGIGILNAFADALNIFITPIRALIVAAGKIMGKNWTMDNIKIGHIPLLATGGIINMPGRGVPIGGAIGGERGAEGVIPLTNAQSMEQIGEAIGRYVVINLTNITKLDNRVIAREQRNLNNQQNFAYNK